MARNVTPARERATTTRTDRANGAARRQQDKTAKLTLEQLVRQIKDGEVDTVIIAITDLQGRWMGKRLTGSYFLDYVDEALHGCEYLLAMDIGNEPYGRYIEDYHSLQGTKAEWFNRLVRNGMEAAGVPVENSKGEWGFGQQEINLRYAEALEMGDRHVVYKNGVKEIAALNQVAVTFMAKWSMQQAGSSFHLHSSFWDVKSDRALFHAANGGAHGMSPLFQHYLAGLIALARDFSLFYGPFVNSFTRYQATSFAPTPLA